MQKLRTTVDRCTALLADSRASVEPPRRRSFLPRLKWPSSFRICFYNSGLVSCPCNAWPRIEQVYCSPTQSLRGLTLSTAVDPGIHDSRSHRSTALLLPLLINFKVYFNSCKDRVTERRDRERTFFCIFWFTSQMAVNNGWSEPVQGWESVTNSR